jgi:hypothetical protein
LINKTKRDKPLLLVYSFLIDEAVVVDEKKAEGNIIVFRLNMN